MKSRYILLVLFCFALPLSAQRTKTVKGEYTYYAESSESPKDAKLKALERARLQAIASEFGTAITQSTTQNESLFNGDERTYFSQLSDTEVKGEWLEDTTEPVYDINYVQDMLVVKCWVEGRARELSNEAAEFTATILRNGVTERYADVNFRNGDDMYLYFKAPTDGYIAAYLVDETPTAYCLLPYMSNIRGQHAVKHDQVYVFFSQQQASKGEGIVDEYTLTCHNGREQNQIYVLFSPLPFAKALDSQVDDTLPRQLNYNEFRKWVNTCRKRDRKMGLKVIQININE